MFMIYLNIMFHMPISSSSLLFVIQLKDGVHFLWLTCCYLHPHVHACAHTRVMILWGQICEQEGLGYNPVLLE
jgi:hypothetical protein